ncbi:uncharacterized protein [Haliotis cracherodii]|uniref:uncharacterized protein n=1 Tax=Haliotis cracherodii TaxID=6455 RepID=UPI0039EC8BA9
MAYHTDHYSIDPLERMTRPGADQYRNIYHKTPTKRKYEEVDIDEYDTITDHGYFSQSPMHSNGAYHCPNQHRTTCDCRLCCQDDDMVSSRRPPRDQFTGYAWPPYQSTLRNIYENTPTKVACCQPRRCYTDVKHIENIHRPSRPSPVPRTCLTSRKRLSFDSSNHERQTDSSQEFKFSHVRDLRYDMESVDVRYTPKSELCANNINNEGPRMPPCRTHVQQSSSDREGLLYTCPLQPAETGTSGRQSQSIHGSRQTTHQGPNSASSCKCSSLKHGFITLAANAFSNIKRKDSSAESFQQFKTEVDRTNEFLKQTLEILTTFKDLCGH